MIKITAIGNLGKDATVNTVNSKNVINFSLASTDKWTGQDGNKQEKTIWLECAYWSDKIKVSEYLKKGTQVYVEGNADVRTWEKDGKTGVSLTCRVMDVKLLGSSDGAKTDDKQPATETASSGGKLPF